MASVKEIFASLFTKYPNAKTDLKAFLSEEDNVVKFATAELADGTKLYTTADAWAVGCDAFTDEGGAVVADGSYEVADGTKIVVSGGMVSEIIEVENSELSAEQQSELAQKFADTYESLEAANAELSKITESNVKMSADIADLKKKIVTLSKLPGAASVKFEAVAPDKPMNVRDRVLASMDMRKDN